VVRLLRRQLHTRNARGQSFGVHVSEPRAAWLGTPSRPGVRSSEVRSTLVFTQAAGQGGIDEGPLEGALEQ